ncbi:hypothetical protein [Paludibacterium paludis]|uniref:TetR transcriptional regulator CgmR-like C-terminal domain-containing protein n=1 Tax=Paludibacterium paludis TaxID=1225769 RepID=A0A918UAD7_9NEIS|nr:hypothetical protein [Paludibacterium paludis]GGY16351.1 hypothetical protein GCM10011289_19500 [Paludibacterium paludis]
MRQAAPPRRRRARLAFFTAEGLFMLRYFKLMTFSGEEWEAIQEDLADLFQSADPLPGD